MNNDDDDDDDDDDNDGNKSIDTIVHQTAQWAQKLIHAYADKPSTVNNADINDKVIPPSPRLQTVPPLPLLPHIPVHQSTIQAHDQ
ncbi:hypothetical protein EYC84_010512 [Monilinia fructicola]|uniref:Uncharacterized protein n=1 Tax=Monilinia fructicola TaxID=38448 RepID=A0A5M9J5K0_MONFR|nr:hypothetical protein EYC84_010512 [Monilinia fructicola]